MTDAPAAPRCLACKSDLRPDAKLCPVCQSSQTWTRHLGFSSTVLSLLVALISVSGLVIPLVTKAFKKPKTAISLTYVRCEPSLIHAPPPQAPPEAETEYTVLVAVLLNNHGSLPGAALPRALELDGPQGRLAGGVSDEVYTLKAGAYDLQVLKFHLEDRNTTVFPDRAALGDTAQFDVPVTGGKITFRVVDHEGGESNLTLALKPTTLNFHRARPEPKPEEASKN